METIIVEKPHKYNICFETGFDHLGECLRTALNKSKKAMIVTDTNVEALYLKEILKISEACFAHVSAYVIEAGEQSKTLKNAENIICAMIEEDFNRDDCIIALGGGVVGDLAGFCAGIYMRGIDFAQIPTTLLSQIDSSIGGKVAVDMNAYKNMIGVFHSPALVYENSSCIKTLPKEQYLSGMGEVLKSALLGDRELWAYLLSNFSSVDFTEIEDSILSNMLKSTCMIKKRVVEEDPFDTGKRGVLNLGHTVGHAIEKSSDFALTHGQCVALGTICALYISMKRNYISAADYEKAYDFIGNVGLMTEIPTGISLTAADILGAIKKDKKNSSSGLKFILLEGIGNAVIKTDVSDEEISDSLKVIGIAN